MIYRLEYTARATEDLREIGDYIRAAAGEAIAARFMSRAIASISRLRVMPTRHRIRKELQPGLRAVSVESYIVFLSRHGRRGDHHPRSPWRAEHYIRAVQVMQLAECLPP